MFICFKRKENLAVVDKSAASAAFRFPLLPLQNDTDQLNSDLLNISSELSFSRLSYLTSGDVAFTRSIHLPHFLIRLADLLQSASASCPSKGSFQIFVLFLKSGKRIILPHGPQKEFGDHQVSAVFWVSTCSDSVDEASTGEDLHWTKCCSES